MFEGNAFISVRAQAPDLVWAWGGESLERGRMFSSAGEAAVRVRIRVKRDVERKEGIVSHVGCVLVANDHGLGGKYVRKENFD